MDLLRGNFRFLLESSDSLYLSGLVVFKAGFNWISAFFSGLTRIGTFLSWIRSYLYVNCPDFDFPSQFHSDWLLFWSFQAGLGRIGYFFDRIGQLFSLSEPD